VETALDNWHLATCHPARNIDLAKC